MKVKDPCTGHTLAEIKNPKVKIQPYKSMEGVIDIQDHIANRVTPKFFEDEPPLNLGHSDTVFSWPKLSRLISSDDTQ